MPPDLADHLILKNWDRDTGKTACAENCAVVVGVLATDRLCERSREIR
jgi:hypothetical protein